MSLSYSFRRIIIAAVENSRLFPLRAVLHAPEDTAIDDMKLLGSCMICKQTQCFDPCKCGEGGEEREEVKLCTMVDHNDSVTQLQRTWNTQ